MDQRSLQIILYVLFALFVIVLVLLVVTKYKEKKRIENGAYVKASGPGRDKLYIIYRFFKSTPVLNKTFYQVKHYVEIIYPADKVSIDKKISVILTQLSGIMIGGIFLTIIIAKTDIFFMVIGFYLSYVFVMAYKSYTFKQMNWRLLYGLSVALSKIEHLYVNTKDVAESLQNAVYDIPYEIGIHIQKIHDIIVSPNVAREIDKYNGTEPNSYMSMLLSSSASVKEYGDKILPTGTTEYMESLHHLKEDVEEELLYLDKNEMEFKGQTLISILPVLAVKPIELWAKHFMPTLSTYYEGIYGIIATTLSFLISMVVYRRVVALRDGFEEEEKYTSIWMRIANIPVIEPILDKIVRSKYSKYKRIVDKLQALGDYTGSKAFLASKFGAAICAFVVIICLFIGADITQKSGYINNWTKEYETAVVPDEEYKKTMEQVSKEYVKVFIKDEPDLYNTPEKKNAYIANIASKISQNTSIKGELQSTTVAEAIVKRIIGYHIVYFRFYYLLVALLVAVAAFFVPDYNLKQKHQQIQIKQQEEVIQYQSLMLILMNLKGIDVETILEWMERFSYCFREQVIQCRVTLTYGKQRALKIMKNQTTYEPFKDFVDNLLEIDNVGVANAFQEISTARDYFIKKRAVTKEKLLRQKSASANRISLIPLYTVVVLMLIVPIALYAFSMFQEISTLM